MSRTFIVTRNLFDLCTADARHILVRLCTRKPEKWFRLKDLDGYRKRFGDRVPTIMDELCRDLVRPIVEGPDLEPEVKVMDLTVGDGRDDVENLDVPETRTVPVPALPPPPPIQDQSTKDIPLASGTVSVKVEATDCDNLNLPTPSIPDSLSSETAPKVEELSQPGPSCLPPQPWEYVVVARDEEHAPIEDLLNSLTIDELQILVKSLKVKCASKKVS